MPTQAPTSPIVVLPGYTSGRGSSWGSALPLRPAPDGADLRLDLSDLGFVEPLFLLRLRAFIDWHSLRGHAIHIIPPSNFGVRNYLVRMGVFDDLPEGCSCDAGMITGTNRKDVLVELTRMTSPMAVEELDYRLQELLGAHFPGNSARLAAAFIVATGELADNATTHGRNDVGAYVAAQRYQTTRCVLAIGDLGVGIPEHMRSAYPALVDDGLAILEATKEGVTAAESGERKHRGIGYATMIEKMVSTSVAQGSLRVWSGHGRLDLEVQGGLVVKRETNTVDRATVGTWVRVELMTV